MCVIKFSITTLSISCTIESDVDMCRGICVETSLIQNMFLFQINGYDGYEDTKEPMILVFC